MIGYRVPSAKWALAPKLNGYMEKIVVDKSEKTNVLLLNFPPFEFVLSLLKLGVNVQIVDSDTEATKHFLEFVKGGKFELQAEKANPSSYTSANNKLSVFNQMMMMFNPGATKYNAIFDVGFLLSLPNPEIRRAFGDKLIAMAAEKAKMLVFNIEKHGGKTSANELNAIDLNLAYGRGFYVRKDIQLSNVEGFTEQLYLADKTAAGGQFYDEKYSKGYAPWHMSEVNYNLLKYYNRIQPESERTLRKILVPMSGKTVDIKWLADKGHEVVAVEISQAACREIFNRDNIPFEELDCPQVEGKLFVSKDNDLRIKAYCCDVFKFTKEVEGEFQSGWERGAVIAFEDHLREKYYKHISTLFAKGCLYMVSVFQYDRNVYYNHPYCVNDDEVRANFGAQFNIESLDENVFPADREYSERESKSVMVVLLRRTKLKTVSDRLYLYSKK